MIPNAATENILLIIAGILLAGVFCITWYLSDIAHELKKTNDKTKEGNK
jgi:hypothetical protein